jgi:hypothetical protein
MIVSFWIFDGHFAVTRLMLIQCVGGELRISFAVLGNITIFLLRLELFQALLNLSENISPLNARIPVFSIQPPVNQYRVVATMPFRPVLTVTKCQQFNIRVAFVVISFELLSRYQT